MFSFLVIDLFSSIPPNWPNYGLTLLVGGISLYGTQKLMQRQLSSAEEERRTQAKENLLRVLEMRLIETNEIPLHQITNLTEAIDREYSVNLSGTLDEIAIMQDLELRIQDSRHLSAEQKAEYASQINEVIQSLENKREEGDVSPDAEELFEDLQQSLVDRGEEPPESFEQLKGEYAALEENIEKRKEWNKQMNETRNRMTKVFVGLTYIVLVLLLTTTFDGLPWEFFNLDSPLLIAPIVAALGFAMWAITVKQV